MENVKLTERSSFLCKCGETTAPTKGECVATCPKPYGRSKRWSFEGKLYDEPGRAKKDAKKVMNSFFKMINISVKFIVISALEGQLQEKGWCISLPVIYLFQDREIKTG